MVAGLKRTKQIKMEASFFWSKRSKRSVGHPASRWIDEHWNRGRLSMKESYTQKRDRIKSGDK